MRINIVTMHEQFQYDSGKVGWSLKKMIEAKVLTSYDWDGMKVASLQAGEHSLEQSTGCVQYGENRPALVNTNLDMILSSLVVWE